MSDRWATGRVEAFSDGVFAIAITLLVLEIGVPENRLDDLWTGIADQWPSYFAYVTSFTTIGGIWLGHHGIFRRMASADSTVMRLNLLLLMLVSFLPFPTKLLAESLDAPSEETAAVILYGAVLLAVSITLSLLWRHIAGHRELLEPGVSEREVGRITRLTTPNIGFYLAVILLALIAPQAAAVGFLVIAVVSVFRQRGGEAAGGSAPT
jgi:uncharacterized membrane protein